MYFTQRDGVVVFVLDLIKVGVISFPVPEYSELVKLMEIFPSGYHTEKYVRLLIEENKVVGIGHITEDLLFMIPTVEQPVPEEE